MQVVYFPEEFNARAPALVGCLCVSPGGQWITLLDIVTMIRRGETISIRPASESEKKRAEANVALYEIGVMLGEKIQTLLDQETPEEATRKSTAFRDAIESIDLRYSGILDRTAKEQSSAPSN